ncbi:M23 family metallopeptidase [uncultured Roseibium sp.]|uniref:murein hydrolase activator EnvC family protein n=1 Tax=uncultured Roseibium sp. TaxID=1936171 RepID=UPI002598E6EB|nr:M23 family metallopeptidase [uncultured Roseibium sp.]
MKRRNFRWQNSILFFLLLSPVLFFAGDFLRYIAQRNIQIQDKYISAVGVAYVFDDEAFSRSGLPSDLQWMVDNDFFRKSVVEPAVVLDIKSALPGRIENLYFSDVHELFEYLKFIDDYDAFDRAFSVAMDGNSFSKEERCATIEQCSLLEISTISPEHFDTIITLVYNDYLLRAKRLYVRGALEESHRLALKTLTFIRKFDFEINQTNKIYNDLLITTAFLTDDISRKGLLDLHEIEQNIDQIYDSGSEENFISIKNEQLRTYRRGLYKLYNGCPDDTSDFFYDAIVPGLHGPYAELYAFLSVRAFARLVTHRTEMQQNGCAEPDPNFQKKFNERARALKDSHIRHIGLRLDVDEYVEWVDRYFSIERAETSTSDHSTQVQTMEIRPSITSNDENSLEQPLSPEKLKVDKVVNAETAEGSSDESTFRWPVRGRIISDFGPKPGGGKNEGINLAVPEGTPVKAARGGTVIYAGNELKGYGELVLIRHDEGWVTAYAHNSELKVSRSDKVERGGVIALAGATGSVSQPQVHFELRKGNKPVDPMPHLPKRR